MSAVFDPATRWWWSRTDRERQMLAVMVLLIAGVLIWLVVVRPMWSWREAAAERREEARITLLKVDAGVRRLSRDLGREGSKGSSADIEPVIRQSAEVAGLVVTTGMDPSGGLGFRVDSTTSAQIFPWLAALKDEHGLEVSRLAVVENADATLQVDGGFAPSRTRDDLEKSL
ncbi:MULTISPECIES: type II secretion system protein GspM [Brevundimonas]|jgi:general secretion pathway protein M|uniref:Type II secretion system protein M n=1 Tax=Brevundimonas fontaquae TaxID=2813778 RepID=A0ABX7LKL6_9CAUL|nr:MULTISPECIES: type II secretion system protein GspM [Brevundimonas]QIF81675.1 type II secretion system protein M [Brevundimonas sp. 'scallop']QSF53386.1 type II secretion system protein M [Brevundimonas fontaquae]